MEILADIFQIQHIVFILIGLGLGIVFGAIPGLNAIIGVAIVLPFTFFMTAEAAFCLLIGIYKGGVYAGSIPAILLNIPGAPESAATAADGYAMAAQGKPKKALLVSLYASVAGCFIGDIVLISSAAWLGSFALKIGPAEMFCLLVFALTVVGAVSGKNLIKGIISGLAGLLTAAVGMDVATGVSRFTFGIDQLSGGIPFLGVLMGLFAISEILIQAEKRWGQKQDTPLADRDTRPAESEDDRLSLAEAIKCIPTVIRSSIIGVVIGAIPGPGATTGAFVSYATAQQFSKNPEQFGKGSTEGVAAPESGNNATCSATLIPLLTLGIPGSPIAAIFAGALMIHGINPGPEIFSKNSSTITLIYAALLVSSVFLVGMGLIAIRYAGMLAKIKNTILYPIVLVLCYVGTYSNNSSYYEIVILTIFGVVGYFMRKLGFSCAAFIIAFVIAAPMEVSMKQALLISSGDWSTFTSSPIGASFLGLTVLSVLAIAFQRIRIGRLAA